MSSDQGERVSDQIGARLIEARQRAGLSREALADAARSAGLAESFSASALRNIESGRPDDTGRRRRDVTVDELLALAAALGVPPASLLGESAALFAGPAATRASVHQAAGAVLDDPICPRCLGIRGDLEAAVRDDVDALGDLVGMEPTLAQTAYTLARAIDGHGPWADTRALAGLAKELRATLAALIEGRDDGGHDDGDLGDLGTPA